MHRKLAVLLAASAFALAACDSPADAPEPDAPEAMPAGATAAPTAAPAPGPAVANGAAVDDAPVDEDAALQAAYEEGKAAAADAIDAADE